MQNENTSPEFTEILKGLETAAPETYKILMAADLADPLAGDQPLLIRMERKVGEEDRERMRERLQEQVDGLDRSLGGTAPPQCCGKSMKNCGRRKRTIRTLHGEILLRPTLYRCETCAHTCSPLKEALGVEVGAINGALARLLALLGVIVPYEMAARLADRLLNVKVNAMAVWRCTQRLGQAYTSLLEARMRADLAPGDPSEEPPSEEPDAPAVVEIALDGCMLGMQRRTQRRTREAPGQELPALPKIEDGNFREVKTAAIFLPAERVRTSPSRHTLVRRVLVTCLGNANLIYDLLWSKLQELKWLGKNTLVVIVADGAEWIWNRTSIFPRRCEILDFWHAVEHAWKFARVRFGENSRHGARWISRLTKALRTGKIKRVLKHLERVKTKSPEEREELDALIRYYTTHQDRMRYDKYLRSGYSIGSGAVESAHKQLVHARMRQSGMRWSEAGARRLLALRQLLLNDDWDLLDQLRQVPIPA